MNTGGPLWWKNTNVFHNVDVKLSKSKNPILNIKMNRNIIMDSYHIHNCTLIYRSSWQRCSVRKGFLINFAKFTGKHLCQSLFFNKVAGLRSATLLKKRLWHRCFPVNFVKFLRTPFWKNTSGGCFLICYKTRNCLITYFTLSKKAFLLRKNGPIFFQVALRWFKNMLWT